MITSERDQNDIPSDPSLARQSHKWWKGISRNGRLGDIPYRRQFVR